MIQKIDKEIKIIEDFIKSIVKKSDLYPGFISELLQVADKTLSQLQYMKELIGNWEKKNSLKITLLEGQSVFIRSKTDNDWMKVRDVSLLEVDQTFTTEEGQRTGKEYKLLSQEYHISEQKGNHFVVIVEIIKG